MSNLMCRRGGYRYIYDDDGHVEQVDEIKAKMTNISWFFSSACLALSISGQVCHSPFPLGRTIVRNRA